MIYIEGVDDRLIANNLEPFYLTHPGEVIKDELEFRGINWRWKLACPSASLTRCLMANGH